MPSSCSISSSRSKGFCDVPVHLVDKSKNGDVRACRQTLNSFSVCRSTPLAASITMHRAVGRHQRAVGILGKVLMSRSVQDVDAITVVAELQNRAGHRDAALLFDLHPIRHSGARALFAFHRCPPAGWRRRTAAAFRSGWSCPRPGGEMMANVRRLSICSIKFSTKILQTRYPC